MGLPSPTENVQPEDVTKTAVEIAQRHMDVAAGTLDLEGLIPDMTAPAK